VASRLGRLLARTFVEPVWVAGPAHVETWTCASCGREIVRTSPAVKGLWVAPTPAERTALCARQHGVHDRHGIVVADLDEASAASADDEVPVVERADGSLVALVPPAGLELVPDADGDGYLVLDRADLRPSDLVGGAAPDPGSGPIVGHLAIDAIRTDDHGRPSAVAARRLPQRTHNPRPR
jgi:hypothetical protein